MLVQCALRYRAVQQIACAVRERWVAGQLRRASALLVVRHAVAKAALRREWRSAAAKLVHHDAEERAARERAARRARAVEMVQQTWRKAWTRHQWQEVWRKLDTKARRERAQVLVAALVRRQLAKRIIRQRITHLQRMQRLRASLFEATAAIVPVQKFLDAFRKRRQEELRATAARRIIERYGTCTTHFLWPSLTSDRRCRWCGCGFKQITLCHRLLVLVFFLQTHGVAVCTGRP